MNNLKVSYHESIRLIAKYNGNLRLILSNDKNQIQMNILGIMSGTSCDGLDLCNVKIDINKDYNFNYEILNFFTIPFSDIEKNIDRKCSQKASQDGPQIV